jgi:hypothetical protein
VKIKSSFAEPHQFDAAPAPQHRKCESAFLSGEVMSTLCRPNFSV